ncbi:Z band alternatively spliced PDZ-motif protein 52 isoform X9 [Musca autumnalis]|uniref:Z band alternatively spliced PDZ-motif protein 52 isoform X9 n=1 Tax=Musca autumnalis TaxID=221902 RepID=UPI003CF3717C
MAQPQMLQIKLSRFDAQPWGFRLQGGTDFAQPLLVQKVNGGSLAEKAGLMPGDAVLKINDVDVFNLRHKEAQDIVVRSGNNFVMTVQRGGSTWRPHVTPTGNVPQPNQGHLQTVTKTSLAHKQQESQHIGCGYNNAAKPFGNTVDGNVKSIVNKQYNTPVGIYSDESIAETLSAQAEVLAGGVLGVNFKKNEKEYQADKSEVLKFLREEESGTSTPAFGSNYSGQDQQQQQHQQTQYQPQQQQQTQYQPQQHQQQTQYQPPQQQYQPSATKHVTAPVTQPKPPSTGGLPVGQNICYNCERLITGVFVRIKDKNLHVECFKCATCGTSLKNQGYYNFNNKLYCDIHAKLAAMQNPPPGTDGYVPVPIKPNTKLSASTITSALSAHGFNGVSNGSSTPTPAPVAPQQQLPTTTTTSTPPPSSNLPIVDKSLINSDNTKTNSNLNICNSNNTTTSSSNTATNDMSSRPSISEQSASNGVGGSGDKPFEYVTITGNVIRSVVPPGKGTNVNYKVNNQGYARPYGAPPAAAPKSPVTFPPQTQQWNAPPPTQPKPTVPAGNPYATLPRSNVGQGQVRRTQSLYNSNTRNYSSNYNMSQQYKTPSFVDGPNRYSTLPSYNTTSYNSKNFYNNYNYQASPFPDRARSPAPGPPPNPLAAIRAPRLKENEVSTLSPRVLQAGSITTGQSYLGAQQAQKQERMLSHTETSAQSGMQSYSQQPEKREEYQVGNLSVQRREQSASLAEQQQRQLQSQTTTQVGNTQIERRRKVTEEFEHTSSAKTVEIRTGSQAVSTERRQSYGRGFVANQARRLSGLEQEITNLTPQSQAISARAATLTETKFPELHSPEPTEVCKFPTKPILPPHDEPQAPSYVVSGAAYRSLANTSSSKQQEQKLSSVCGSSVVSTQQQQYHQLQQQQQQKSLSSYSSVSSSQQQQQQQVNTVSSSLTKASATTSLTNNQAYKSITAGTNQNATSTTATTTAAPLGVCPVTGTFCRPGHTCCKQQLIQSNNNNNVSNGAAYRPNASLGSGNASNNAASCQQQQQQPQPQRQQQLQTAPKQAPAPAPAPTAAASASTNLSTPSSNVGGSNDSAGGVAPKGGAYGATSAPKRGRGIMNKPVASGVRTPLCHSCSTQIRGPFITALGKIWCPEHFHCVNGNCRRPLQDIGFVEEKGDLYCEYCFEKYLAPTCSKCAGKIKGDCLNAIGKHFHPECFSCGHCGKLFGNTPFFLEDGMPYCEADWNELFTTKCFACGFPVEAGDRWVEALNHNYHSQCFNCTYCKQNLEGQSFYNKGGRPFCKNHAR